MSIVGTVQARFGSTRFPGKVLREICGKPMILHQVERLRMSRLLDDVIIATTVNPGDDRIVEVCGKNNIRYFRGSENDVLNRIASLISDADIETHVEFFGDSPLVDPHIIDEVIGFYLKNKDSYDVVTNSLTTTYPPGQEVTVFSGRALLNAEKGVPRGDPLREHVSIHLTQHPDRYRICNLEAPERYRFSDIYLEVDSAEDFQMISTIVRHFIEIGQPHFSLAQILEYLAARPEVACANRHINRRWKAFKA